MNHFKLLTRAATRHQHVQSDGKTQIPSGGLNPSPTHERTGPPTSSSKGKRRRDGPSPSTNAGSNENGRPRHDTSEYAQNQTHDSSVNNSTNDLQTWLAAADCKKICNKHKIKVHRLHVNADTSYKTEIIFPQPLTSFTQLREAYSISPRLYDNIRKQGYAVPSEVQMGSLPLLMRTQDTKLAAQKYSSKPQSPPVNLLAVAPTGSGKTLAFLIPTIQSLLDERYHGISTSSPHEAKHRGIRAIILAPTHELVEQIANEGKKLAHGTGIRVSSFKAGMKLQQNASGARHEDFEQDQDSRAGHEDISTGVVKSDIIVSTPPMLSNAVQTMQHPLDLVGHLILDEADVLLGDMFHEHTLSIWQACTRPSTRTSLWSATISSSIESLALKQMLDRRKAADSNSDSDDHELLRIIIGTKDSSLPTIDHRLVYTASEQGKLLAFRQLLNPATISTTDVPSLRPPFLVFTQTIPRAIALHSEILYDIPVEAGGSSRIAVLHSDLSETARSNIMTGVRRGNIWVLITTDLLSRGIDFRGMNGVVSYDIPNTSASYVHRAGRTGRQGREGGLAITFYTKEDVPYVKNVANVIAVSQKNGSPQTSTKTQSQDWLLDSLPDVSKKTRQKLKQGGIEHRKTMITESDSKKARRMRISTKSGYDRRLSHRRRGIGSKTRLLAHKAPEETANEVWEGFER